MGARRGLMNVMLRRVEIVRSMPKYSIRRKLGEARRDTLGLFDHVSTVPNPLGEHERYTGVVEAREYVSARVRLYEHQYRPTKGWLTLRA